MDKLVDLVARLGMGLGKGPGYVALAFFEAAIGAGLVYVGRDVVGYAGVLAAVNAGVYGGGAFKAVSEAKKP